MNNVSQGLFLRQIIQQIASLSSSLRPQKRLVITENGDVRMTPRISGCSACRSLKSSIDRFVEDPPPLASQFVPITPSKPLISALSLRSRRV